MLVSVKGSCSPQNDCQETPLHLAIVAFDIDRALLFIEAGADLSLCDNLERTPLDLAQELEQGEVVAAIQRALSEGLEEPQRIAEGDEARRVSIHRGTKFSYLSEIGQRYLRHNTGNTGSSALE
jgi:ankyrin repeat protein